MTKLTESAIEGFAIEQFEQLGCRYVYGPSIAPDAEKPAHWPLTMAVHRGTMQKRLSEEVLIRGQEVPAGSD